MEAAIARPSSEGIKQCVGAGSRLTSHGATVAAYIAIETKDRFSEKFGVEGGKHVVVNNGYVVGPPDQAFPRVVHRLQCTVRVVFLRAPLVAEPLGCAQLSAADGVDPAGEGAVDAFGAQDACASPSVAPVDALVAALDAQGYLLEIGRQYLFEDASL